jgi:hypothetical protein
MSKLPVIIALASVAALGCQLGAVSTNYWSTNKELHWGLWKQCITVEGVKICSDLPGKNALPKGPLNIARVFMIISLVVLLVATICYYAMPQYKTACISMYFGSAIFAFLAVIVWIAKLNTIGAGSLGNTKGSFGYSYYLAIVGGLVSLGAGFLVLQNKNSV